MVVGDLITVGTLVKSGYKKAQRKLDDVTDIPSLGAFEQRFVSILEQYINTVFKDESADLVRILNANREDIFSGLSETNIGDRDEGVELLLDSITEVLERELDAEVERGELRQAVETAYKEAIDDFVEHASDEDLKQLRTELAVDIQDELESIKRSLESRPELYSEVVFERIYPERNSTWKQRLERALELEGVDFPFAQPPGFDDLTDTAEEKILLVGLKGGGKTRTLFESASRFVEAHDVDTIVVVTDPVDESTDLLQIANAVGDGNVLLLWDDIQQSRPEVDIRKSLMQLDSAFEELSGSLFIRAAVRQREITDVLPEDRGLDLLGEPVDPSDTYAIWQQFEAVKLQLEATQIESFIRRSLEYQQLAASEDVIEAFVEKVLTADPTPFYIRSICDNTDHRLERKDIETLPNDAVATWESAFNNLPARQTHVLKTLRILDEIKAKPGRELAKRLFSAVFPHETVEFKPLLERLSERGWVHTQSCGDSGIPSKDSIAVHDVRLEATGIDFDHLHPDISEFLLGDDRILRGDRGAILNMSYAKKVHAEQLGIFPNEDAERHFERATEQNSETDRIHVAYARYLTDRSQYEAADEQWQLAVDLDENNRRLYAAWLRKRGRVEDAKSEYETGLESEPTRITRLRYSYANYLEEIEEIERAIEVFEAGITHVPESSLFAFRSSFVRLLRRNGYTEKAIAVLRDGLGHETGDRWFRLRLTDLLEREGKIDEAISVLEQGLKQEPGNGKLRRRLAELVAQQDEPKKAIDIYERALKRDPTAVLHREALAALLEERNKIDQSIAVCKEGLTHEPEYRPFRHRLIELLADRDRTEELIEAYEDGIDRCPRDSLLRRSFTAVLEECGHTERARTVYEAGLDVRPGDAPLRAQYAHFLAREAEMENAVAEYDTAISHGWTPSESDEPLGLPDQVSSTRSHAGGSADSTILIEDWTDLAAIRDGLSEEYLLVTDLTPESPGYDEVVEGPEAGWEPVGHTDQPFVGTFDGGGHVITGLRVDRTDEQNVGLFSKIEGAEVTHLTLNHPEVVGGGPNVGAVVGTAVEGRLTELKVFNGNITATDPVAAKNVGGVVGTIENGEMSRASVDARIHSARSNVGGIAGRNTDGVLEYCWSNVVIGARRSNHGGIAGYNSTKDSEISDCASHVLFYTLGPNPAGITGLNNGHIRRCYAAGEAFTAEFAAGGVVAVHRPTSEIEHAFWERTIAPDAVKRASRRGGGTSKNVERFEGADIKGDGAATNLRGLGFEHTWKPIEDPDGFPKLTWLTDPN